MSPSIQSASLDIRSHSGLTGEAVEGALKERRIPAVIGTANGRLVVRVALDETGGLVVAREDGGVTTTVVETMLTSLAAEWRADVTLENPVFFASASFREETLPQAGIGRPTPRAVYVVGGAVPIDPERRQNIAAQLEASISVVPAGDVHLLQSRGDVQEYWLPAQRPVVAVKADGDALTIEVYSRAALESVDAGVSMRGIPDLTLWWQARWRPVLSAGGEVGEVERMLGRAQLIPTTLLSGEENMRTALGELGTDLDAVERLLGQPNDDHLVDVVAATLGLPVETADLVRGRITIDDLPGSQHIERTAAGRVVWEQLHRRGDMRRSLGWWRRLFRR